MSDARCDGCLGTGECWVCLGYGVLDTRLRTTVPCRCCLGSGRCFLCQNVAIGDLGDPPALRP